MSTLRLVPPPRKSPRSSPFLAPLPPILWRLVYATGARGIVGAEWDDVAQGAPDERTIGLAITAGFIAEVHFVRCNCGYRESKPSGLRCGHCGEFDRARGELRITSAGLAHLRAVSISSSPQVPKSPSPQVAKATSAQGDTSVEVCSCGRAFAAGEWMKLPLVGTMDDGDGGTLALRNCPACGSTRATQVGPKEEDKVPDTLPTGHAPSEPSEPSEGRGAEMGGFDTIDQALASMGGVRSYTRYVVLAPGGGYYTSSRARNGYGHRPIVKVRKWESPVAVMVTSPQVPKSPSHQVANVSTVEVAS